MYIDNQKVKQGYRFVYLFFCISGIILQYANAAVMGGNSVTMLTAYYTMLTNMLCFVYFGYLVIMTPKRENPMIKGMIVLSIVLTGLGYHILLSAAGQGMEGMNSPFFAYSNLMVHTITPLLAIIDYFLFTPKGDYKWYYPLVWLIIPLLYVIFVFIRAELSSLMFYGFNGLSRFPYPFLDVDAIGGGYVTMMIFIMMFVYIGLGYLSYGIDKLLKYIDKEMKAKKGIPYEE